MPATMSEQRAKEEHFLQIMEATEEYLSLVLALQETLKKGMFNISQARYSFTGPLGQAQYHAEMEALTRVQVSEDHSQFSTISALSLQPNLQAQPAQSKAHLGEGGDPLRWFGVLVPPPLRSAQKDFLEGVNVVTQLAAARNKLQAALKQAEHSHMPLGT